MNIPVNVNDSIKFKEEKQKYNVRAVGNRFIVCNKPFNARKTVLYTVIDTEKNIRGTENLIFGAGAETDDDCKEMLYRLETNYSEVSYKNFVPLRIEKINGVNYENY